MTKILANLVMLKLLNEMSNYLVHQSAPPILAKFNCFGKFIVLSLFPGSTQLLLTLYLPEFHLVSLSYGRCIVRREQSVYTSHSDCEGNVQPLARTV